MNDLIKMINYKTITSEIPKRKMKKNPKLKKQTNEKSPSKTKTKTTLTPTNLPILYYSVY